MEPKLSIESKTSKSLKWSFLGELVVKLISPITNMILARLLLPEVFGIVATISIIISFSELLADSGFSKAIIQKDFKNNNDFESSATTAFWTTIIISIFFFSIISIFNDGLSSLVGSPGYGLALTIAAIQIPIFALSSIHLAVLRRNFEFKKIFWVRFASALVPLIFSTILAFLGFSYWSLIISSLMSIVIQTTLVLLFAKWKPTQSFNFRQLKDMLSFSALNMIEALLVWLTASIDVFIIVYFFDTSLTGMYRMSTTTVQALIRIVTAVFTPVLFSSLSRLKDNKKEFDAMFSKFQKMMAFLLFPVSVGLFLYRDLATLIFFGQDWMRISMVVGLFSLTWGFVVPINNLASIVYFSKKKPIYSIIAQIFYTGSLLVICLLAPQFGFDNFVIYRGLSILVLIIPSLIFLTIVFKISFWVILKNITPAFLASASIFVVGFFIQNIFDGLWWDVIVILICVIMYISVCMIFFRKSVFELLGFLFKKNNGDSQKEMIV